MDDNSNTNTNDEKAPEPTPIQPPHRSTSLRSNSIDATQWSNAINNRKGSTSSVGSNSGPSFTQRLIERGVAVPSSFSNWEKIRPSEDSSSPGSFDFDSYYGMSPFITPSFSTAAEASHFHQEGPLYKSLRHRYEKEKGSGSNIRILSEDDEDGIISSPEFVLTREDEKQAPSSSSSSNNNNISPLNKKQRQRTEDSDIELSDEEDASNRSTPTQEKMASLLPLNQRQRRSRSPLAFPPTNNNNNNNSQSVSDSMDNFTGILDHPQTEEEEEVKEEEEEAKQEKEEENASVVLSPDVQRLKNLLITRPKTTPATAVTTSLPSSTSVPQQQQLQLQQQQNQNPKPLPSPPRKHLLQTPVFQVVNANTVKDRYLFLFDDLLLICKPIMDENIIVSSSARNSIEKNRYRFRPNENSLFQVKNIVQLGQLSLYISKDDYRSSTTKRPSNNTVEIGPDGRPILPPARKIHPIMASALRKFETNANLGIQYLVDKGVLTNDPLSIANFLFKTPDLNRRQLGYYLSDDRNSDVYDSFLECFRLVGLRLDEALRILLTTFRLPSNWEALEYLIERFAKKWHDANQNVIKFHEDMVVKVVVAMLFLNAECWYDATSERDVFWYARELKERQDRQAKRKMSVIDYHRNNTMPVIQSKLSSSATTSHSLARSTTSSSSMEHHNRQSVTVEPLHYITSLRAHGSKQPSLEEFLDRWNYYDQYHLVPREFMEEMYKSIMEERLETGWDNKTGRRIQTPTTTQNHIPGGVGRPKVVSPSIQQGSQDVVITVIPHRLPTRLTKGMASDPITISIPAPDAGLQIKLRGQDLGFEPNVLDFSNSCIQTFTITGNTLGRTSLMFIKTGENAGNYVSPTLPRTKSVVVERPFMRYTFQVGFKHVDHGSTNNEKEMDKKKMLMEEEVGQRKKEQDTSNKYVKKSRVATRRGREEKEHDEDEEEDSERRDTNMVNRKYTFSVETEEERVEWLEALKRLSGHVNAERNEASIARLHNMNSESRVALQVLKEVLLADEVKKGTARTKGSTTAGSSANSIVTSNNLAANNNNNNEGGSVNEPNLDLYDDKHGRTMKLLLPKKKVNEDDRNSIITTTSTSTTANVVTKRGHEIVKLVVQNSMVPLVLGFLKNQIS